MICTTGTIYLHHTRKSAVIELYLLVHRSLLSVQLAPADVIMTVLTTAVRVPKTLSAGQWETSPTQQRTFPLPPLPPSPLPSHPSLLPIIIMARGGYCYATRRERGEREKACMLSLPPLLVKSTLHAASLHLKLKTRGRGRDGPVTQKWPS